MIVYRLKFNIKYYVQTQKIIISFYNRPINSKIKNDSTKLVLLNANIKLYVCKILAAHEGVLGSLN